MINFSLKNEALRSESVKNEPNLHANRPCITKKTVSITFLLDR